jgi:uncharacterized protein (DUF427 family)
METIRPLRPRLHPGHKEGAAYPAPGFAAHPDYLVEFVPSPKRVRVVFAGETVADSTRVMLMRETGHLPAYYFPPEDVRPRFLERTDHHTH